MKKAWSIFLTVILLFSASGCGEQAVSGSESGVSVESSPIEFSANEPLTIETDYGSYVLTVSDVLKTNWLESDKNNDDSCAVVLSFDVENIDFKNSEYEGVSIVPSAFSLYDSQGKQLSEYSVLDDGFQPPDTVLPGNKSSFGISYLLNSPSEQVDVVFSRNNGQSYKSIIKLNKLEISETEKEAIKNLALVMDSQIYDIVLRSEKITGLLQEGSGSFSENPSLLLDLYDLAKTAQESQHSLFSDLYLIQDDSNKDYIEAAQLYVINGQEFAENLLKYLDKQELKYASAAKECLENSSTYVFSIVAKRMEYLTSQGFTDEEVLKIISPDSDGTESSSSSAA